MEVAAAGSCSLRFDFRPFILGYKTVTMLATFIYNTETEAK